MQYDARKLELRVWRNEFPTPCVVGVIYIPFPRIFFFLKKISIQLSSKLHKVKKHWKRDNLQSRRAVICTGSWDKDFFIRNIIKSFCCHIWVIICVLWHVRLLFNAVYTMPSVFVYKVREVYRLYISGHSINSME